MDEKEARLESLKGSIERYGIQKFFRLSSASKNAFLNDLKCDRTDFEELYPKETSEWESSLDPNEGQKILALRMEFLELISGRHKQWSEATEILVNYIKSKYNIYTTKDDLKSEMWIYKEGIYVPQGRSEVKIILRNILREWYSQYIYGLVMAKLEVDTFVELSDFYKKEDPNIVAVQNGLLNIFTKKLIDFDASKIFLNKLPVIYNPEAKCEKIEKFLDDVLPNPEDKRVYYEIGGFCLLDDYRFEKAFMFVGDGRNGKDKSLELIKKVIGMENCCSIPLASLQTDSFVISELFNRKVNLAGDISSTDLKDTSTFKALTGRSLISGKRKFMKDIVFVNSAKFIFACNQLPMVYDLSKGFWERWILLEYPYTFVNQKELEKISDKSNFKLKEENIIDLISSPEELSGLLNKFLEGLERLVKNKDFSFTKGSEQIKNLWIRKSNSFIAFCMDNIKQDYEKKISKKELRRKYAEYCKEHKIIPKSDIVIKRVLQEDYGANEGQGTMEFGNIERFWEGINWK